MLETLPTRMSALFVLCAFALACSERGAPHDPVAAPSDPPREASGVAPSAATPHHASPPAAGAVCGDGVVQAGEQCDDGDRDCPDDWGACLRCDPDCHGRSLHARDGIGARLMGIQEPFVLPSTRPVLFCEERVHYNPPLRVTREHDARGWPVREDRDVDLDGRADSAFTFRFDAGRLRALECDFDLDGRVDETRRFRYDDRGRLARLTSTGEDAFDGVVEQESDTLARFRVGGAERIYEVDARGLLVRVSADGRDRASVTYDASGRVETVARDLDRIPRVSRFVYGPRGLLDRVEHPHGDVERLQYDARGRVIAIANQDGQTGRMATYTYDCLDELERTAPAVLP